ncbi:MAG: HAD hydrolase-like protein [Chloroflexi bacterium]|nr:HAD hydrolase-like protein [Chloroflexota bacterium]
MTHLFFDLDGTLTDPKEGIVASFVYALDRLGRRDLTSANLDWCIGPPLRESFARLLATDDPDLIEQAVSLYREYFAATGLFENFVYPEVVETLQLLKKDFQLLIATSKPAVYARQILEKFELAGFFEAIYGAELDGRYSNKGELIGLILEQEQLSPAQVLMIGDREHDILGAKRNTILAGGVTYGYGSEAELTGAGATYLFHRPSQIPTTLVAHSL